MNVFSKRSGRKNRDNASRFSARFRCPTLMFTIVAILSGENLVGSSCFRLVVSENIEKHDFVVIVIEAQEEEAGTGRLCRCFTPVRTSTNMMS